MPDATLERIELVCGRCGHRATGPEGRVTCIGGDPRSPSKHVATIMVRVPEANRRVEFRKLTPNYELTWEVGLERLYEEGSSLWQHLREEAGLTRVQLYEAVNYEAFHPARQELIEDGIEWPNVEEVVWYARLAGCSPGELVDRAILEAGQPIVDERRREGG